MSMWLAYAFPPAALISFTTSSAGVDCASAWPATLTPKSLTTTAAPCAASSFDTPRPMPRPPPVTTATFPSSLPIAENLPSISKLADTARMAAPLGCDARKLLSPCYSAKFVGPNNAIAVLFPAFELYYFALSIDASDFSIRLAEVEILVALRGDEGRGQEIAPAIRAEITRGSHFPA